MRDVWPTRRAVGTGPLSRLAVTRFRARPGNGTRVVPLPGTRDGGFTTSVPGLPEAPTTPTDSEYGPVHTPKRARKVSAPMIPPTEGATTGTQAYLQSEFPLPGIGRRACARRGPRS